MSASANHDVRILAGRIAPWLRFAAEHMVGKLHLSVPVRLRILDPEPEVTGAEEAVLELPVYQGAKTISVALGNKWRLRLQAPGLFTWLTFLVIHSMAAWKARSSQLCARCAVA